jgi:hypothetical protein
MSKAFKNRHAHHDKVLLPSVRRTDANFELQIQFASRSDKMCNSTTPGRIDAIAAAIAVGAFAIGRYGLLKATIALEALA